MAEQQQEEEERTRSLRELMEREVAAAKETETKMLESLIQQTKELEQAKIALAEAKLEVATLRTGPGPGPVAQAQWSVMDLMFGGVDEEINGLRGKLRAATQAEERSRKEAEDLTASLSAVTMEAKQVKAWLSDAQAEDENGGLRRALEQAVEEANAAGESLEFATGENARLRDAVAAKERALESLRQENEALRASEAAAQARAKDLQDQLAAAAVTKKAAPEKAAESLALEKWRSEAQGKLSAAFLDSGRVMAASRKDRMFASLSNIAELRSAAAAAAMDDYDYEFDDHFDDGGRRYGELEHAMKHKKRRSVLRKFGDFFRKRSLYTGPTLRQCRATS